MHASVVDWTNTCTVKERRFGFDIESSAPSEQLDRLVELTERYSSYQTLLNSPPVGFTLSVAPGPRLTEESAQARAERTYNSAADFFDLPALGFWNRFGQATVDRLGLQALRQVLAAGGVDSADIEAQNGVHQLSAPEDWWSIVLGTGYRNTVDGLGPEAAETVHDQCIHRLTVEHVYQIETNVIYARSQKPAAPV